MSKAIKYYLCFLLSFLFLSTAVANPNLASKKIIYLISTSRSLSTAFLRMMETRGDFTVFNEPSHKAYGLIDNPEYTQKWVQPGQGAATFQEVKEAIFKASYENNVFVKEISFTVADFLKQDPSFLKHKDVHFVLLVRDPHPVTISHYLKSKPCREGLSHKSEAAIYKNQNHAGFEPLYEILNLLKKYAYNPLTVILTEDLYHHPKAVIQSFCQKLEIPFIEDALHWPAQDAAFTGHQEWGELKKQAYVQHWQGEAIRSTGFCMPHTYEIDKYGYPTFSEIKATQDREILRHSYTQNVIFYEKILKEIPKDAWALAQ